MDDMSEVSSAMFQVTCKENGTLYMLPYPQPVTQIDINSTCDYLDHHLHQASLYKSKQEYEDNVEDNIDRGWEIPIVGNPTSLLATLTLWSACWNYSLDFLYSASQVILSRGH